MFLLPVSPSGRQPAVALITELSYRGGDGRGFTGATVSGPSTLAQILAGRLMAVVDCCGAQPRRSWVLAVPAGVASVQMTFAGRPQVSGDTTSQRMFVISSPVHGNVAVVQAPRGAAPATPRTTAWLAPGGRVVRRITLPGP